MGPSTPLARPSCRPLQAGQQQPGKTTVPALGTAAGHSSLWDALATITSLDSSALNAPGLWDTVREESVARPSPPHGAPRPGPAGAQQGLAGQASGPPGDGGWKGWPGRGKWRPSPFQMRGHSRSQ